MDRGGLLVEDDHRVRTDHVSQPGVVGLAERHHDLLTLLFANGTEANLDHVQPARQFTAGQAAHLFGGDHGCPHQPTHQRTHEDLVADVGRHRVVRQHCQRHPVFTHQSEPHPATRLQGNICKVCLAHLLDHPHQLGVAVERARGNHDVGADQLVTDGVVEFSIRPDRQPDPPDLGAVRPCQGSQQMRFGVARVGRLVGHTEHHDTWPRPGQHSVDPGHRQQGAAPCVQPVARPHDRHADPDVRPCPAHMVAAADPATNRQYVAIQRAALGRDDRVSTFGHDLARTHLHGGTHLGHLVVVTDAERGGRIGVQTLQVAGAHRETVRNRASSSNLCGLRRL